MKEFKHSLSSYCDIGLYNLKIQMAILEKIQVIYRFFGLIELILFIRISFINYQRMVMLVYQTLLFKVIKLEKILIPCYVLCLIQHLLILHHYLIQNDLDFSLIK